MSVMRRKKEAGERFKKAGGGMGASKRLKKAGGEVRISGGIFRGQKIRTPGGGTHPMGERERIALFNMLGGKMENSLVADLYCGGGTLGIEALSRGASVVLFVDKNPQVINVVKENLEKLKIDKTQTKTVLGDVISVIKAPDCYDIVIADPPYDKYTAEMVAGLPRLVADDGILALSHPGKAPELAGLVLVKTRSYAGANISVYQKT